MKEEPGAKAALVRAAADLFRRQGYAATGLNDVLKLSGTPKGSLYHYFPGGKSELGAAAITYSGKLVETTLQELSEASADSCDLISGYVDALCGWLEASDYRHGNPITTTLLEEAPQDQGVTRAGFLAFQAWIDVISASLLRDGVPQSRSNRLARIVLAALDGALVQARVQQSTTPLREIGLELSLLVRQARP